MPPLAADFGGLDVGIAIGKAWGKCTPVSSLCGNLKRQGQREMCG